MEKPTEWKETQHNRVVANKQSKMFIIEDSDCWLHIIRYNKSVCEQNNPNVLMTETQTLNSLLISVFYGFM